MPDPATLEEAVTEHYREKEPAKPPAKAPAEGERPVVDLDLAIAGKQGDEQ